MQLQFVSPVPGMLVCQFTTVKIIWYFYDGPRAITTLAHALIGPRYAAYFCVEGRSGRPIIPHFLQHVIEYNYRANATRCCEADRLCLLTATRSKIITTRCRTKSSAHAKSTARPSCLVGVLYNISRKKICWWLNNHFYVIGHESYSIRWNNAK